MSKSSFNQENVVEKHALNSSPGNYSQSRSFYPRDHYSSSSAGHINETKHKKGLHSIPTQASDAMITSNGVPEDLSDNSIEYPASKEGYGSKGELDPVPETSVEYSEPTNKTSNIDSDLYKNRLESENEDKRFSRMNYTFPNESLDMKYDFHLKNNSDSLRISMDEHIPKNLSMTYTSPKYETETSAEFTSKHWIGNGKRIVDEGVFSASKKHNYDFDSPLQADIRNGPVNHERMNGTSNGSQPRMMTHSEVASSLTRKTHGDGMSGRKSPAERQNISDFSDSGVKATKRSTERYDSYLPNKNDYQPRNVHGGQHHPAKEQPSEAAELRDKNEKLEEQVAQKEKMVQNMRESNDEIYKKFLQERDKVIQLEEQKSLLQNEIENLKQRDVTKSNMVTELEGQIHGFIAELHSVNNKWHAKVEVLNQQIRRLEEENYNLIQSRRKNELKLSQLEISTDGDKFSMLRNLEESNKQLYNLTSRNEDLLLKVETLKRFNQVREKEYREKIDESMSEAKEEAKQQYLAKINHYKAKAEKLLIDNENLKLELQSRPTLRRYKEHEAKIQTLENELEDAKHHMHQEHRKKGSEVVGLPTKILKEVIEELEIDGIGEIIPKIKELQHEHKADNKFVNSILDLVYRCSPSGYFEKRPNPKQAWKWLKLLMEEYMNLKKQEGGYELGTEKEILRIVMDFLRLKDKNEVPRRLRQLVAENTSLMEVIDKVKTIHKLEWVNSLSELDQKLDEIRPKHEEPYYKSIHYRRNNS